MRPRERTLLAVAILTSALSAAGAIHAAGAVRLVPESAIYVDAVGSPVGTPTSISCDAETLAFTDRNARRIVLFDLEGESITARGEIVLPELPLPRGIALSEAGRIYVLDDKLRKIAKLTADATFEGYVELDGFDGRKPVPRAIAVGPGDALYVLDVHGSRVLVLSDDGATRRSVSLPSGRGGLSDLAVGPDGSVYILDSVRSRVLVVRADGDVAEPLGETLEEDLDFAGAIAVDDGGRLFIVDRNGGGVVMLGTDGEFRGRQLTWGWREGQLRDPADVCSDGRGRVFVAERQNRRIQVFTVLD